MDEMNALIWWLSPDAQQHWEPYSAAQINAMLANNQVSPSVYVWREGMLQWTPLQQLISQNQQNTQGYGGPPAAPDTRKASDAELARELKQSLREGDDLLRQMEDPTRYQDAVKRLLELSNEDLRRLGDQ